MRGKFIEGDEFQVPASGNEKTLKVLLPTALSSKYDLEKLSLSGLDTSYEGYTITWVNNFRLKLKPGKTKKNTKVDFEVQFEKPDLGELPNQRLFIYDGKSISMPDPADYADLGDGKIAARLRGDDPAMGWGGG
jgi:hypothetical protein